MNETSDRIRTVVHEVLGKTKAPPAEPDPTYPENLRVTGPPGSLDDDLYLQPSGGFGSRSADAAEAARIEREQQQLKAQREARASETFTSPTVVLAGRLTNLEQRLCRLEERLGGNDT